jgi:hypothetical protein
MNLGNAQNMFKIADSFHVKPANSCLLRGGTGGAAQIEAHNGPVRRGAADRPEAAGLEHALVPHLAVGAAPL